jgi:UbiD family decarboxylase
MEVFYIGGASVKLFLPIFKMNFPAIVDLALPVEGIFYNLVFVSIRKTCQSGGRCSCGDLIVTVWTAGRVSPRSGRWSWFD